jgi:hypothetical protein
MLLMLLTLLDVEVLGEVVVPAGLVVVEPEAAAEDDPPPEPA